MALCFSVNRGIYGYVAVCGGVYSSVTCNRGIYFNIFNDYTYSTIIFLYSWVPRNIIHYIHQHYVPRLFYITRLYR
jgi:hypothetical protein